MKIYCKICDNTQCFIRKCSPEWIATIDSKKTQVRYAKGQHIFLEGIPVLGIYFIQQGKVKVIASGINGKKQIVRLANDGHILGHRGYGGDIYPVSAVALEDSLICFVENHLLYKAFMENPEFTFELMMFYSRELRKTEIRTRNLAQMNVREKVAETLLFIKEVFDAGLEEKILRVSLSRQEYADLAGTTAEQVSRYLTDFENEKLISKKGKKIQIINEQELRNIIPFD